MSVQRIEVDLELLRSEIGRMSAEQIDELPFGAIQLDDEGRVVSYNRYEEKLAKRDRNEVVGKNFFHDVAPCTRVRSFYGAFQEGIRRRELNEVFDFVFRFPHGERHVRIRMILDPAGGGRVWIFVTPLG
jgi:photoactive yellow protein